MKKPSTNVPFPRSATTPQKYLWFREQDDPLSGLLRWMPEVGVLLMPLKDEFQGSDQCIPTDRAFKLAEQVLELMGVPSSAGDVYTEMWFLLASHIHNLVLVYMRRPTGSIEWEKVPMSPPAKGKR